MLLRLDFVNDGITLDTYQLSDLEDEKGVSSIDTCIIL